VAGFMLFLYFLFIDPSFTPSPHFEFLNA
jgi:hypothetical protein